MPLLSRYPPDPFLKIILKSFNFHQSPHPWWRHWVSYETFIRMSPYTRLNMNSSWRLKQEALVNNLHHLVMKRTAEVDLRLKHRINLQSETVYSFPTLISHYYPGSAKHIWCSHFVSFMTPGYPQPANKNIPVLFSIRVIICHQIDRQWMHAGQ